MATLLPLEEYRPDRAPVEPHPTGYFDIPSDGKSLSRKPKTVGVVAVLTAYIVMGCIAMIAAGFRPPFALEPTLAGIVWAVLFLAGFSVGSFAKGQLIGAACAWATCWVANVAFVRLSSFTLSETMLLSCGLVSCGWWAAQIGRRKWTWLAKHSDSSTGKFQIGMWDLALLASVVAVAASCWNHIDTPAAFAACAFFAMMGGLICSWIAGRWVLHDKWSLAGLLGVPLLAIGLGLAALLFWPLRMEVSVTWLISGPVNAIAAQAATVLLACAVLRWETRRSGQETPIAAE